MKKILSVVAVGMLASSAFAQGTLTFANDAASLVRLEGGAGAPANGARVQFAWAPVGTAVVPYTAGTSPTAWLALNPGWSLIGTPVNIAPVAGRFSGGVLTAQTSAAGAVIQGVVFGWNNTATSATEGWANALATGNGQFGISAAFTVDTGDPTTSPAGSPGAIYNSTATPYAGFSLAVVPEPTSFALAGLGAAALMIFRRRK